MKIIINLISTYLVTNSLISLFFLRNQKKELDFQQDGDLVIWYFCLLFIASRTLFQRHVEFN